MNFTELAEQITSVENQWGQDKLAIWGGVCVEQNVLTLLKKWPHRDKHMPFRIWEYSDKICFQTNTLPESYQWLERGRLFGPGGDLSVRREQDYPVRNGDGSVEYIENCFCWHFLGQAWIKPPAGEFHAQDFWASVGAGTAFHHHKDRALLWGERKEAFELWFEDRTGPAKLEYPSSKLGRLRVEYQMFSRAGQVEFVWFLGLEDDVLGKSSGLKQIVSSIFSYLKGGR